MFAEKRHKMSGSIVIIGVLKVGNDEHLILVRDRGNLFRSELMSCAQHMTTCAAIVVQELHT